MPGLKLDHSSESGPWLLGVAPCNYYTQLTCLPCRMTCIMIQLFREMSVVFMIIFMCPGKNGVKTHDVVIKWKPFPRYWPFVRTKAGDEELWCFLTSAPWINGWVNNREAGDLRRNRAHFDIIVMMRLYSKLHLRAEHQILHVCCDLRWNTVSVNVIVDAVY